MNRFHLLLFFPSFLFSTSLSAARSDSATLAGVVRDAGGRAMAAAEVRLTAEGQDFSRSAATRSDGSFAFEDLPPGSYLLEIRSGGFAPEKRRISLDGSQRLDLEIRLTLMGLAENMVVTASRTENQLERSLSAVTVITGEGIE